MKTKTSEFGKGFVYNLVLFAKHFERVKEYISQNENMRQKYPDSFTNEQAISLWFNGAADHLYELNVPARFREKPWYKKLSKLQDKALKWRLDELGSKDEFNKFWKELEKIIIAIDKDLGAKPIKAQWN